MENDNFVSRQPLIEYIKIPFIFYDNTANIQQIKTI